MGLHNLITHTVFNLPTFGSESELKVLFINHTGNLAGAERSLIDLVSNLKNKGINCKIIIPHHGVIEDKLRELSIAYKIVPFEWWAQVKKTSKSRLAEVTVKNNQAILDIAKEIKSYNPDIVFTNTIVIPWGALAAKLAGTPHVWSIRELGTKDHKLKFEFGTLRSFKIIDNLSEAIFVNSKTVQKEVYRFIPSSKIHLFYSFIRLINNLPRLTQIKDNSGLKLTILGSIMPSKGQMDALKAINRLKAEDISLNIVGPITSRSYFKQIMKYIKDNNLKEKVTVTDFTDDPYSVINNSDVILICSRNEAFGRVVTEAMLLKKAVIGTRCGGIKEQIKNGRNGFLYKPGASIELAKRIKYLIKNPKTLKKIARAGHKSVLKKFTEKKCVDDLISVMLQIKNKKHQPLNRNYPTSFLSL